MEKEPEKEIFVDPQNTVLMDGLGYRALCAGGLPTKDKDGNDIIIFTIKPDEVVRKRYNLRFGHEIDDQGNTKITIAKIDLIPMNIYDDSNRMWLYTKSFNHDETELSIRDRYLKIEINRLNREVLQLEAENLRLSEVNELLRTNPEKAISTSSELFQKVASGLSSLNKRNEDK